MLPFALSVLGFGKSLFQAVLAWLSRRSLSELASIALLILCLIEFSALHMERRHARKVEAQLAKCVQSRDELSKRLHEISTARDNQKIATDKNVKIVTRIVHDANEKAVRIEQAPPASGCKTNLAVMGADL